MTTPDSHANFDLVLLDRDGVLNEDSADYIKSADEWHALPGTGKAVAQLTSARLKVAVCTNQSGLARGLFNDSNLADIHAKLQAYLNQFNTRLDHIYWCPHGPNDGCDCRKPAPGLLLRAMADFQSTPQRTAFVGDSLRDLEAAEAAQCQPVLVLTGNGLKTQTELTQPQHQRLASNVWVAESLRSAAQQIVGAL